MAENSVAVLGGTFNPVHNGHLAMAYAALDELGFSRIVFLPNGNPPHKSDIYITDAEKRYDMVSIAAKADERFEVSDYEIKQKKMSYTIETLPYLKSVYGSNISYIIGADSLYALNKWKDYRRLILSCRFVVADRESDVETDISKACEHYINQGADIVRLKMPKIDITSTRIRELCARGADFRQYVPDGVYEYIINNNLYQPFTEDENDY